MQNKEKTFEEVEEEKPKTSYNYGSSVKKYPSSITRQERASGYCESCHKRYDDVPVIDGKPQCPRCSIKK